MGVLHIVVHPYPVDKPQWLQALLLPGGIIFIEGVIEIIVQDGIHPDGVGAQFLDPLEPAEVGLLVDGVVGGKVSRDAHAQVDAPDLEGLVHPIPLHVNGVFVGLHKCGHRLIRVRGKIDPQVIVGIVPRKDKHHQSAHGQDKFFQKVRPLSGLNGYTVC